VGPPISAFKLINFSLQFSVVQHPRHARMNGFTDRETRPIDPPVVARLRALGVTTDQLAHNSLTTFVHHD